MELKSAKQAIALVIAPSFNRTIMELKYILDGTGISFDTGF